GLLLLTLMLGSNINDASRWIPLPIINQSFPTSDLAKVVLVVYLARVIAEHQGVPWALPDVLGKPMPPAGAICGLILPANFSTAALLFTVCLAVMFIGRVPVRHLAVVLGGAALAFGALLMLADSNPDLLPRMATWSARIKAFSAGAADSEAN